jgi:hypothetical protein
LGLVKLTTVNVTKLPLKHKIRKIGIICSAKPVLTMDLRVVKRKNFQLHPMCAKCAIDERPVMFIGDIPIFSSERMLHVQ